MKNSALDYLIEFVNDEKSDLWLKQVVTSYINLKGNIDDVELNLLADELITNKINERQLNNTQLSYDSMGKIEFSKLKHESGINALSSDQEIYFSKDVTLIYGLNGSGKSSYYRILQAMIGTISADEIVPNIYLDNPEPIKVNFGYSIDGTENPIVLWNNNGPIDDLHTVKVFDTSYSQSFLGKRESDEHIMNPYKLHIFSEISSYIDRIKEIANKKIDESASKILSPNTDKFTETLKNALRETNLQSVKEMFDNISASFNSSKKNEITEIKSKIDNLLSTNHEDKKRILETQLRDCKNTRSRVEKVLNFWIEKSKSYHEQWQRYEKLKDESETNRKSIAVLNNLPGIDSKEWKDFVRIGLDISKNNDELEKKCPYCHQPFDNNALEITKAYSLFINDTTEKQLNEVLNSLKSVVNDAKSVYLVDGDFYLEGLDDVNFVIKPIFEDVKNYIDNIKSFDDDIKDIVPINADVKILLDRINEYITQITESIKIIEEESKRKDETISYFKKIQSELLSEQSVHNQINIIDNYFDKRIEIENQKNRVNCISSNKITRISGVAHKELLTDQLTTQFNDYLMKFGIKDREIELTGKNHKGKQQTELIMRAQKNVNRILSEGEQKAVSIALFLAEISVSKNKSTIIFDDPVNSLDHRMIEILANVILQLGNQIVVFTHNRMFYDAIKGSEYGHSCKDCQGGCSNNKGKHIYVYEVKSEGPNDAGVITLNLKNNAKGYLEEAKVLLNISPFTEELKVCALLRNAVDHIIDEIVFNNQVPRKYSMKGQTQSISWEELKKMASNPDVIDKLKVIFGRLSSGQLHYGQVSTENPPDKQELLDIQSELEGML